MVRSSSTSSLKSSFETCLVALLMMTFLVACTNPLSKGEDGTNSVLSESHSPFLDLVPTPSPTPTPIPLTPFTANFDFNSSTDFATSSEAQISAGAASLLIADTLTEKTDDATATASDDSLSDYAVKDANVTVASDKVLLASGSSGQYTSKALDGRNLTNPWTQFNFKSSLPFGKELATGAETGYGSSVTNFSTNLVGLWHLNESANGSAPGGTDLKDESGNGLHATRVGAPSYAATGIFGNAISTSAGNYFSVPNNAVMNFAVGTSFSLSVWVKTSLVCSVGPNCKILVRRTGTPWYTLQITKATGVGSFELAAGTNITGGSNLFDNKWHHIVGVVDRSATRAYLYVDGVAVGNAAFASAISMVQPLYFGHYSAAGEDFLGNIDEVAMWSRALTPAQISELYRRGANRLKFQIRTCTAVTGNDCSGGSTAWVGPNGTNTTFFNETHNTTAPTTGLGTIGTSYFQTPFSLFTSGLTAWLGTSTNGTNRFVQYQATLESDSASLFPDFQSGEFLPTPRYATLATATSLSTAKIQFAKIDSVTISEVCTGSRYEFSNDSGASYQAWTGAAWATNAAGYANANSAATLQALTSTQWNSLPVGDGYLWVRAYLSSDGATTCTIGNIQVNGQR